MGRMKCKGCYIESKQDYCLPCRKKLFNKLNVSSVLNVDAPNDENLLLFQEQSKKLSISGVQLKYSLKLNGKQLELCEKGGEYILKPIPVAKQLHELDSAPENEHLTMQLAEQIFNIHTAANALVYFKDGQPAYITKRFDVMQEGRKYLQEDFTQLLSRSKQTHGDTYKYEGSYQEIGRLIKRYVAASIPTLERFFKLVLFNYMISNGDAHLKNFSLIRNEQGEYLLTPAYDLMSRVLHTPTESDTALSLYDGDINSEFYKHYGFFGKPNFIELAIRLGILEKRAERIILEFIDKKNHVIEFVNQSFLSDVVKQQYCNNYIDKMNRIDGNNMGGL
jgi:serine/threonine-protein kinase HipA